MALTVRFLFLVLMVYLGCDNCRPEGKAAKEKNSVRRNIYMNRNKLQGGSDFDKAPLCGRRFVVKDELRRAVNGGNNSADDIDDDPDLDKIQGGGFATYGEFPWMANILYDDSHYCGGGIISEFWVITAAHCLSNGIIPMYSVAVGDHTLGKFDQYETEYKVQTIVFHSDYRDDGWDYDIGLIKIKPDKLGRGIKFNNYVQPFCLAYATEDPGVNTRMTITGWGNTAQYGDQSVILKKVHLPTIWYGDCKAAHPTSVTMNMFCVGDGDETTCHGDSGGPVFAQAGESVVLYGTVAFGNGCGSNKKPAVMMSIPKYRGWIDTQIRQHSRGLQGLMPTRRSPF